MHPLALMPYELVRGRAAPTKGLLAISSGVLIAERLLTLADMALPWFLTMTAHALVTGNPARIKKWVCCCGHPLDFQQSRAICQECEETFIEVNDGVERTG